VIADSLWAALEGRKALKVEWDDMRIERLNTDQLLCPDERRPEETCFVSTIRRQCRWCFERTENKVEAIYETPYEAHAHGTINLYCTCAGR
jgi:isoquinoline 1-oxidoreductase beta subunit